MTNRIDVYNKETGKKMSVYIQNNIFQMLHHMQNVRPAKCFPQ